MTAVADTGPLIALAKVGKLEILLALYGDIRIPRGVEQELFAKQGPEHPILARALASFIHVDDPADGDPDESSLVSRQEEPRDLGESQAIALAKRLGVLLLIDEKRGREIARASGVRVSGVAGVLIQAKVHGIVPAVRPLLEQMQQKGYWLSDAVVEAASRLASEV